MAAKNKSRKKKKIGKWIALGIVAVVIVGIVIINVMSGGEQGEIVTSAVVSRGEITSTISTSGLVESETTKTYYANTTLRVASIDVKVGDTVSAGEQLITFDEDDIMQSISQALLSYDADNSSYLARIQHNQEYRSDYNQAVADVANYEALIDAQKDYIDSLEDGITAELREREEAIAYEIENLNIQNLSYQREIAKLTQTLEPEEIDYYNKLIMSNNMRLQQLQTESSLLRSYFETSDNKEELLEIARNDLADLQADLNRAKSERDAAENAIMNSHEIAALDAGNELSDMQTQRTLEHLEEALNGITADFDGIVTAISVSEGARVTDGVLLITVQSSEDMVVRFGASKYDLEDLAVGQSAVVTVTGNEYEGVMTHIDHMATTNTSGAAVVMAEVTILNPDDNIYLGIDGKVRITTATETDALIVPVEAVNTDRTGDFCYVVEDGVARVRYVTTGISSTTEIQILEGLNEGEEVITTISNGLADGVPVIVMNGNMQDGEESDSIVTFTRG